MYTRDPIRVFSDAGNRLPLYHTVKTRLLFRNYTNNLIKNTFTITKIDQMKLQTLRTRTLYAFQSSLELGFKFSNVGSQNFSSTMLERELGDWIGDKFV